jgi:hypothetical protein
VDAVGVAVERGVMAASDGTQLSSRERTGRSRPKGEGGMEPSEEMRRAGDAGERRGRLPLSLATIGACVR